VDNSEKPAVLITGAGIGIGAATAHAFADAGYRVIVTDILREEGRSVADSIGSAGGEAEYHHLDVTDTDEGEFVVSAVQDRYGPLHAVVANAGIAHRLPLAELTDDKWDHTHDVDLKGVMRICRASASAMRAAGHGTMIAVSSIMGVAYGWHEHVQYSAAKAGVVGLVRGLAVELAGDGYASTASRLATYEPPRHSPRSTRSGLRGWRGPRNSSRWEGWGSPRTSPM
jgi:3-oxoacyl-[acyl-carrier protein] reductase